MTIKYLSCTSVNLCKKKMCSPLFSCLLLPATCYVIEFIHCHDCPSGVCENIKLKNSFEALWKSSAVNEIKVWNCSLSLHLKFTLCWKHAFLKRLPSILFFFTSTFLKNFLFRQIQVTTKPDTSLIIHK